MRIGIIGAGQIGRTVGRLLAGAGHEIVVSWSSSEERLRDAAAEIGGGAAPGTPAEAAQAEVVLFSPRFEHVEAAIDAAGSLRDKVVIDTTNPFNPERDGLVDLGSRTDAEYVRNLMPGARFVKGFNTLTASSLVESAHRTGEERAVVVLSGDDQGAKRVAAGLVRDAGFEPVDLGGLDQSARQEPGGEFFTRELTVAEIGDLHRL